MSICTWFGKLDYSKSPPIDEKCNDLNFNRVFSLIKDDKNSIIIIGGRFPLYIESKWFKDIEGEGGVERGGGEFGYLFTSSIKDVNSIQDSVKYFVSQILDFEHNVILIYPIPEFGHDVPNELKRRFQSLENKPITFGTFYEIKNFFNNNNNHITTSYSNYQLRSKSTFDLFDSISSDKIFRVYPSNVFCDAKSFKCIANDSENLFYSDNSHLSYEGANIINNLILREIDKIF